MERVFAERGQLNQNRSQSNGTRMYHIDGMKGILCFMVMLGHFWNIYRNCQEQSGFTSYSLNLIRGTFIDNPLLVASFWLYAFLVISGFLLSATRVRSATEFLKKTAKRFLRFLIPVFGACLFIYVLQEVFGFYTDETAAYFTNNWFQKYYRTELGWRDIFAESFKALSAASCAFNTPFWVIRDMFLASVMIYVCNYVDYSREKRNHVLPLLFLLNAVCVDRPVITACMAGYLVGYYREQIGKWMENRLPALLVVVAAFSLTTAMKHFGILPKVFDNVFLYTLTWCFLLILVNQTEALKHFFSSKIFLLMGKISFGVYSFHWPVICSVGSYVLIQGLENQWRTLVTFSVSLVVSVVCTVILSVIYLFTVEKAADSIVRRL